MPGCSLPSPACLRERGWGRGQAHGKHRDVSLRGNACPLPRPSPINGRGKTTFAAFDVVSSLTGRNCGPLSFCGEAGHVGHLFHPLPPAPQPPSTTRPPATPGMTLAPWRRAPSCNRRRQEVATAWREISAHRHSFVSAL
ncbi:hypothetical protein CO2235_200107 [Cupriavidus oxalaticus]|uniref:Uncharacterized protein n=1 Tax=Cupriavidus oxalaticus TaxID=96344 RepID=A0A375G3M8_9BURK|nr:hypothetical protein CO2235_200107 [Cupriavidus oxalaticus]